MKKEVENIIGIELEKSRLNREKGMILLNKAMFLYFCFLFVAVIGFIYGYLTKTILNGLIIFGLIALMLGALASGIIMHKEEKNLEKMLMAIKDK